MNDFSVALMWARMKIAIAVVGGWLSYFVGGADRLLTTLILFVVLDYVTGVMCAVAERKLSSVVGFTGICRKVLVFLLVGVANILDTHVIGTGNAVRSAVVCFYLSNEGISILENAARLGLPIPEKLRAILRQLEEEGEEAADEEEDEE